MYTRRYVSNRKKLRKIPPRSHDPRFDRNLRLDGAATINVQIDPKEHAVAILLCQHVPFNQHGIFATFTNGHYSALAD